MLENHLRYVPIRRAVGGEEFADLDDAGLYRDMAERKLEDTRRSIPEWDRTCPVVRIALCEIEIKEMEARPVPATNQSDQVPQHTAEAVTG